MDAATVSEKNPNKERAGARFLFGVYNRDMFRISADCLTLIVVW
mgnify:CR=1 FL=1